MHKLVHYYGLNLSYLLSFERPIPCYLPLQALPFPSTTPHSVGLNVPFFVSLLLPSPSPFPPFLSIFHFHPFSLSVPPPFLSIFLSFHCFLLSFIHQFLLLFLLPPSPLSPPPSPPPLPFCRVFFLYFLLSRFNLSLQFSFSLSCFSSNYFTFPPHLPPFFLSFLYSLPFFLLPSCAFLLRIFFIPLSFLHFLLPLLHFLFPFPTL